MRHSIIGPTTETLSKRTREERSIDIPEETADVVVGGSKLYGTSKRDVFKRIDWIDFVCT
jgi:hypothetical protein